MVKCPLWAPSLQAKGNYAPAADQHQHQQSLFCVKQKYQSSSTSSNSWFELSQLILCHVFGREHLSSSVGRGVDEEKSSQQHCPQLDCKESVNGSIVFTGSFVL